mgnify:CR=1 FL=1
MNRIAIGTAVAALGLAAAVTLPAVMLPHAMIGIGGAMTGADKGACEPLTGTPYVGQDQFAAACGGSGAAPGDADFPDTNLGGWYDGAWRTGGFRRRIDRHR